MIDKQPASLVIEFEDGSSKRINVYVAVELDVSAERKQSIEFRQVKPDRWLMSFTKPVFDGKPIKAINFTKRPLP